MPTWLLSILKWLAQVLLLPLIKDGIMWIRESMQRRAETKKREEDNAKKVEAYEKSTTVDSARDNFSKLP